MEKLKKSSIRFVLAAVIVLIFFHYLGLLNMFEQAMIKVFLPVQKNFYHLGNNLGQLIHLNDLKEENQRLQEEIARLDIDYIKLASLEAENEYFRQELNYLKEKDFQYRLVDIVGRLPFNDQVVIVNQGQKSGIKEGLAATVFQGVIIGKVLETEENLAYVELLTSNQSNLAAGFSHQSGTNGLVKGKAGSSLVMDLIPQSLELTAGDLVITSGLEKLIPKGLLVGQLSEINSQVGQIFKQATITPAFNYQNLQTLTIVLVEE